LALLAGCWGLPTLRSGLLRLLPRCRAGLRLAIWLPLAVLRPGGCGWLPTLLPLAPDRPLIRTGWRLPRLLSRLPARLRGRRSAARLRIQP
jgi:hypothetical protein